MYTKVSDEQYDKINTSYSLNQEAGAAFALEHLLQTKPDYYVSINMDALVDLVNVVGGIDVENTLGEDVYISDMEPDYQARIAPGKQHINGEQALVYARMRYHDPEGDVGRQKRQAEVIQALIKKLKKNVVTEYPAILNALASNLKTNIPQKSYGKLIDAYMAALENVQFHQIVGRGEEINGIYYQVAGRNSVLETRQVVKDALSQDAVATVDDLEQDSNMLLVDDTQLDLDPGTHTDF